MSLLSSISGMGGAGFLQQMQQAGGMDPAKLLSNAGLKGIEGKELLGQDFQAGLDKASQEAGKLKEQFFKAPESTDVQARRTTVTGSRAPGFPELVEQLVDSVDAKGKTAKNEVHRLITGESDNLHQAMIAMQESGVAFNLLVEVRNKLVESYKELGRMVQ